MLKIFKNIIVFFVVFALCLLVLDRFIYYSESVMVNLYEHNNRIGKTLIPGTNYLFTSEGMGIGTVNYDGYLGKPSSKDKKGGKLRIALIGDSYVESYQLFDRVYFGRIMENHLKNKYGIDAEVMNFGRSGFTLSDMYVYSENFVEKFNPDLILYFIENDDFLNIHKEQGTPYPYIENDSLKIYYFPEIKQNTFILFSLNQMSKYFPLVQMIRNVMNLNTEGQTPEILFGKFSELFSSQSVPEKQTFSLDSTLIKIVNHLSANGKNIIVYRGKDEINPDIYSLINESGVRYLDINDTLNVTKNYFNPYYWKSKGIEGHWNIPAHEIIGKFLAEHVKND